MKALFGGPHTTHLRHCESWHLHQLTPVALTLVVAKTLGDDPAGDHWAVRVSAARAVASICVEFGDRYESLLPRVVRLCCAGIPLCCLLG